ncbi:MAG: type VI secretion system-associated FHA domain protein TagH [Pseudomonadota bacterium]
MPVTLRFQSTGVVPGNAQPIVMRGGSLTIGRGDENDVVLPDPDRLISKRHCAIEEVGGQVSVIDFSTNGTFLNYGKTALGRVPSPLNDGDILTMGPYEFLVEVMSPRPRGAIPDPLEDGPVSHGKAEGGMVGLSLLDDPAPGGGVDFLDDLLGGGGPGGPSRVQRAALGDDGLLPPLGGDDDFLTPPSDPAPLQGASRSSHSPALEDHFTPPSRVASAIPDDWDDFLEPTGAAPATPAPAPDFPDIAGPSDEPFAKAGNPVFIPDDPLDDGPETEPAPEPDDSPFTTLPPARMAPPPVPEVAPVPPAAPQPMPAAPSDDAAARAFLAALGADHLAIPGADLTPTLTRLGHVLRIMVQGLREVLMTRTSIKSEFRMQQTMITAGGNNPLKFSISAEQAVEALVKPATRGYLDPVQAAEQALRDIKAHEVAMMTGMEAALKGILKRLDPEVLEGKIETSSGFGSILKGKKARYWEVYEKMYAEISDQAENDFHELFSKEFARAYQDQLERLK